MGEEGEENLEQVGIVRLVHVHVGVGGVLGLAMGIN